MTSVRNKEKRIVRYALLTAAVAAGCAGLPFDTRDRAESAFRRQNQLSTEFMLIGAGIESAAPTTYESLLKQEGAMLDACRPLNTLAAKQRDNTPAGWNEKRAVLRKLEACEQAASDFADALRAADASSSRPTALRLSS